MLARPNSVVSIFAALFLLVPAGCRASSDLATLAQVNGQAITADEFRSRFNDYRIGRGEALEPAEETLKLKQRVLNELIEEKVMLAEADRRKISVSLPEIDRAIQDIRADYSNGAFDEMLKAKPMSPSRLREQVRRTLLLEKVVADITKDVPRPSQAAVETYWREHPSEFSRPEQIHLQQIVVQSAEDGARILNELASGKAFEELARNHSFTPEAAQGGDLGFIPAEALPKEVVDSIAKLSVGKPSGVIKTDYGYHIVRLFERKKAHQQTAEEATPAITRLLTEKDREVKFAQWRTSVLSQAKIERNYGLLAQIK